MAELTDPAFDNRNEPKGPPSACLFVASLAPETTEENLKTTFAKFGEIVKIKLMKDKSSRPYAFIQYKNAQDAQNALKNTNGTNLGSRRIRVEKAKVNRTLFIARLSRNLTQQQLRESVEGYGPIDSVTIIKDHQTNSSKGCGFVKFVYREDAMEAFMGLKNTNRKWVVEWATSTNDPDSLGVGKCNIYIGNLSPAVTKELLDEHFRIYGQIENIIVVTKEEQEQQLEEDQKRPKGNFAFLKYADPASSANAIEHTHGTEWFERKLKVQYCESQELKTKRKQTAMMVNRGYYSSSGMPPPMWMPSSPVGGYYNMVPQTMPGKPQSFATPGYPPQARGGYKEQWFPMPMMGAQTQPRQDDSELLGTPMSIQNPVASYGHPKNQHYATQMPQYPPYAYQPFPPQSQPQQNPKKQQGNW